MSSVVIAGDTSGSVTLQAPATAGSVVVTLPAVSGTMAVAGGTNVAAGSNTQIQYNASGALGASANLTYGSGQLFVQQTVAGNAQNLALENGSTTGTVTSSFAFTSSGVAKASITSAVYGNGYMAFANNDNTEKMRIDASGNLGIGTTSPNKGSLTKAVTIDTPAVGNYGGYELASGGTLNFRLASNNGATYCGTQTATPLSFDTNGTERMRINSVGSREFTNYGNGTYNTGEATITYSNVSSTTFDVSTLFPSVSGTGSCVGLVIHINNWTGNNSSVVSAIWNGYRASTGWAFTQVSNLNAGASASISISGSGNVVTITFGFGGIYGKAKISLIATS